ncbi:unnamed protein product [Anisakis simplex]|uniref:Zf-AD domain-containing protein n=1 Tax=Anisakis simplex TaxID=6269 RepID=A0A0M3JDB3_ANISI|nr:unnamed protein product [Anisakis simplex]
MKDSSERRICSHCLVFSDAEVDVVPTHESDDLRAYNHLKSGEMQEAGINLRCSVERCTLRLSSADSDDFCAAFKFEM